MIHLDQIKLFFSHLLFTDNTVLVAKSRRFQLHTKLRNNFSVYCTRLPIELVSDSSRASMNKI